MSIPLAPIPSIPSIGYLRAAQIIGDPTATPPIPAILPISKTTFYALIRAGKFPKSMKLSRNLAVWPVDAIHDYLAKNQAAHNAAQ